MLDWNENAEYTINPIFSFTNSIGKSSRITFILCDRFTLWRTYYPGNTIKSRRTDVVGECKYNNKCFNITFREKSGNLYFDISRYIFEIHSAHDINVKGDIIDEEEICKYIVKDGKFIQYKRNDKYSQMNIDLRKMGLLKCKTINNLLRLTLNNTSMDNNGLYITGYKFEKQRNEIIYANAKPDPFYNVLNNIVIDYLYCQTIDNYTDNKMKEIISDNVDKVKQLPNSFSKEKLISGDLKEFYKYYNNGRWSYFSIEKSYETICEKYNIKYDENFYYMTSYNQYLINMILQKCF